MTKFALTTAMTLLLALIATTNTFAAPAETYRLGDATGDGILDEEDVREIINYTFRIEKYRLQPLEAYDFDGNGWVSLEDGLALNELVQAHEDEDEPLVAPEPQEVHRVEGDVDGSGVGRTVVDIILLVNYLFGDRQELGNSVAFQGADMNGDGRYTFADVGEMTAQ